MRCRLRSACTQRGAASPSSIERPRPRSVGPQRVMTCAADPSYARGHRADARSSRMDLRAAARVRARSSRRCPFERSSCSPSPVLGPSTSSRRCPIAPDELAAAADGRSRALASSVIARMPHVRTNRHRPVPIAGHEPARVVPAARDAARAAHRPHAARLRHLRRCRAPGAWIRSRRACSSPGGRTVDLGLSRWSVPQGYVPLTVLEPRTWLLQIGWRRHGLVRCALGERFEFANLDSEWYPSASTSVESP